MARRRAVPVLGLSFLDAMTCGFGAVILFFMIIQGSVDVRQDRLSEDLTTRVDHLQVEVVEKERRVALLRGALAAENRRIAAARGLSDRLLETLEALRGELADHGAETLAQREELVRLQADLRSLEEQARRLAAVAAQEEAQRRAAGDRVRAFAGQGNRQYLTGLSVGGRRILLLVDASASMLDRTLVNVVRRKNLPAAQRRQAGKWRQARAAVDWLTTQLPPDGRFQIYAFDTAATPVLEGTAGRWLETGDGTSLEAAVAALGELAPRGGTSLERAFEVIRRLEPPPDNVFLLTDGLPTQGRRPPRRTTVSGKERLKLFDQAVASLPSDVPVQVLLFPMEGDPLAASAFWRLAQVTGGSFVTPAEDWP